MIYLLYVIYLYHDYTDRLVVGVVVDLGNVPIVGEEDEELVGIAVVETSLRLVVIIMDHVRTILAVGLAGKVVDDAEPFHALHDILEVDVLVVALALSLLQRSVLAVFYADGEEFGVQEGSLIRVEPEAERAIAAGDQGMTYICIQAAKDSLKQYTMTDGKLSDSKASWM